MSETGTDFGVLGWQGRDRHTPELDAQREHLLANNGLTGLEILDPSEIDRAVRIFRRDGFVVVRDALDTEQIEFLRNGVREVAREIIELDAASTGNRGSHRYSFGGSSATRSMLHRPEWQMLVDLPTVTPIVTAIFESPDYFVLRAASGDFCLPGAVEYQPLHSDMGDRIDATQTPVQFVPRPPWPADHPRSPVPVSGGQLLARRSDRAQRPDTADPRNPARSRAVPKLRDEPEWMRLSTVCPAPAGAIQIRDVRAWHGGTPNLSDDLRAIPNLEFYAPWFREPMVPGITYDDHRKLSEHARRVTRDSVIDSSETLPAGYAVTPLPARLTRK